MQCTMRHHSLQYDDLRSFPFALVGEFLGFVFDRQGHPRSMKLIWLGQETMITIAKSLRRNCYDGWIPGMLVEVRGEQKLSKKKAKLKLNAEHIRLRSSQDLISLANSPEAGSLERSVPALVQAPSSAQRFLHAATSNVQGTQKNTAVIKICGKPDCMKRGGKAMCKTLDRVLKSGDYPAIDVQLTGCMGKCSQGPNLVVMPDKKRYSGITDQDIPQVLAQHFQGRSA